MISEISPFKDFVCIKVCHNRRVRCFGIVLVCPCLYTNRTSKELQTLLSLFFFFEIWASKSGVRLIYGCGLYTELYGSEEIAMFLCHANKEQQNWFNILMGQNWHMTELTSVWSDNMTSNCSKIILSTALQNHYSTKDERNYNHCCANFSWVQSSFECLERRFTS